MLTLHCFDVTWVEVFSQSTLVRVMANQIPQVWQFDPVSVGQWLGDGNSLRASSGSGNSEAVRLGVPPSRAMFLLDSHCSSRVSLCSSEMVITAV